jgi:hypothetical protein
MKLPSRNSESNYIKQFARYMYKRPKMTQTQEYKSSDTKILERPTCPELQFGKEQKEMMMGERKWWVPRARTEGEIEESDERVV